MSVFEAHKEVNLVDAENFGVVILPEASKFPRYDIKRIGSLEIGALFVVAKGEGRKIDGERFFNLASDKMSITVHQDPETKNWFIL